MGGLAYQGTLAKPGDIFGCHNVVEGGGPSKFMQLLAESMSL